MIQLGNLFILIGELSPLTCIAMTNVLNLNSVTMLCDCVWVWVLLLFFYETCILWSLVVLFQLGRVVFLR